MATNFPTSLDTLTNPSSSDSLSSPSHSAQHANANDAIEALQAKVGVDGSAVTSSLDYKVAQQGLVLVKTQTIGTATSFTVTSAFSSTFDHYRIVIAVDDANSNAAASMVMGSTATGYYHAQTGTRYTGAAWSASAENDASWNIGGVGVEGAFWTMDIMYPNASKATAISFQNVYMRTSTGYTAQGGGWLNNTTSYTAFTVSSTATFSGGSVKVFGVNNG